MAFPFKESTVSYIKYTGSRNNLGNENVHVRNKASQDSINSQRIAEFFGTASTSFPARREKQHALQVPPRDQPRNNRRLQSSPSSTPPHSVLRNTVIVSVSNLAINIFIENHNGTGNQADIEEEQVRNTLPQWKSELRTPCQTFSVCYTVVSIYQTYRDRPHVPRREQPQHSRRRLSSPNNAPPHPVLRRMVTVCVLKFRNKTHHRK